MLGKQQGRLIRSRSRAVVLWAMIPLAILSGRPVSGCICADGHYELFCRGELHGADDSNSRHEHSGARSDACSCCDKGSAGKDQRSCCRGKSDCCRSNSDAGGGDTRDAGKSCCTPVLRSDLASVIAGPSRLLLDRQLPTLCTAVFALPSTGIAMGAGHPVGLDTGPPPDDLVVFLGRLRI